MRLSERGQTEAFGRKRARPVSGWKAPREPEPRGRVLEGESLKARVSGCGDKTVNTEGETSSRKAWHLGRALLLSW